MTRTLSLSIAAASSKTATTTDDDAVLFSGSDSPIRRITLNRPKALNALTMPMVVAMLPRLRAWDADPSVAGIVICGSGPQAFCAGGDIVTIANAIKLRDPLASECFRQEYTLNHLLGTLSKPYVAFMDGITMGAGAGLSVHGSFRVATERSVFAMPETALGFFPDVGGSHFLSRLGALGLFLGLSGCRLKGPDLFVAGIATHYCHSERLEELYERLCARLSLFGDEFQAVADVIDEFHEQSMPKSHHYSLQEHGEDIDECFGCRVESVESVLESLRKRDTEWSRAQLDSMSRMSPTSMKVFFRQASEGAKMDLAECLRMEYRLSQRFTRDNDFYEAVQAFLIDKNRKPHWRPESLEGVTEERVDCYFEAFANEKDELVLPEGRREQPIFRAA